MTDFTEEKIEPEIAPAQTETVNQDCPSEETNSSHSEEPIESCPSEEPTQSCHSEERSDEESAFNLEPEAENQTSIGSLARDIEAILFISPDPVALEVLSEVTGAQGEELAHAVEAVRQKYSTPDSTPDPASGPDAEGGIVFGEVAGGYTFRTSAQAQGAVERFCARPVDYSLSAAATETLAIIAYLQPVTRPEVARIRGVGADTVVANLLDKGLVEEAGRHQQSGAVKYRTTAVFEKLFGLASLEDLPSLDGFEATAQDVEELRQKLYSAAEKRQQQ